MKGADADDVTVFDKREARVFVESLDGESYGAETYLQIVEQMRDTAWGGEQSDGVRGYMKQVAKRIWDWSQKAIRINSAESFLKDMQREGLVRMRVKGRS